MRVLLSAFIAGGHSGIPRYAAEVCRTLDRVAPEFPDLRMRILTTRAGAAAIDARNIPMSTPGAWIPGVDRAPVRLALEHVATAARRADVTHYFDFVGPRLGGRRRRFTTTIHDLKFLIHPEAYTTSQRVQRTTQAPWVARHAARVIAISQFAADQLVANLPVDRDRIEVIHSGPGFPPEVADGGEPAMPEIGGDYLLAVGNLSATKNLPFLVRAHERSGVSAHLVLVGGRTAGAEELDEAIAASSASERIHLLGKVSDAVVDRLYRDALALVLPSRYEGFAFTPLEAMARGCPVLASDIPAVREISTGGARLLPLDDEAAWATAIAEIAGDPAARDELRRKGTAQVAKILVGADRSSPVRGPA